MKKLLLFLTLIAVSAGSAADGKIDINVKKWKAWGNDSIIDIKVVNNEITFSRRNKTDGWNTPMYHFPSGERPTVTAFTFLSFEYKASRARKIDINIDNASEGTQYALAFAADAGGWKSVRIHLNSAAFKRGGKAGSSADGMAGDQLAGFQIAYSGKEITIRNVCIYEADPRDVGTAIYENPAVKEYAANRPKVNFRQLQNGAVFPFGVIHTLRYADKVNGEFFGQSTAERSMENLRLIRQTGFNSYANFNEVEPQEIGARLALAKKYGIYLLETATSAASLAKLPGDHPMTAAIAQAANDPQLLAFYAQDEPTDIPLYLRNKKYIENFSKHSVPVTSAIHMMSVAKELGAAMDIITIDPYSLNASSVADETIDLLAAHTILVKNAMQYCAGKRVWMIGQAFALRVGGKEVLRFPTAAELRFDVFSTLAAGANGYFAFIWQDRAAYLRSDSSKGESFDRTLCDPWGNLSEEGKMLGILGSRIAPVMSFFLDRKAAAAPRQVKICSNIKITQHDGEYGSLFIAVNYDLKQTSSGKADIPLKNGEKLYDLDRLQECDGNLSLLPGDGALMLAAVPEKFAVLRQNIIARRQHDAELVKSLYINEPAEFAAAREAFGKMHLKMMKNISRFDNNAAMDDIRQQIKTLAKEYFDGLREYRQSGKISAAIAALPDKISKISLD